MLVNWQEAQQKATRTARSAVTMAKVRIRRVASRTRWQLVTFYGKSGAESVGVVDMLAIRKDHSLPIAGMRRGDALQIILIQVKGGGAANPTFAFHVFVETEAKTAALQCGSAFDPSRTNTRKMWEELWQHR